MIESAKERIRLALVNIVENPYEPQLGIVYIATYISKRNPDIDVRIIDINFEDPYKEIVKYSPHIVGLGSMTIKYNQTKRFAEKLKRKLQVPILIGGVHITTCPEDFGMPFDIGVIGEGEQTMLEVVNIFQRHRFFPEDELYKIDGIIYISSNGEIKKLCRGRNFKI